MADSDSDGEINFDIDDDWLDSVHEMQEDPEPEQPKPAPNPEPEEEKHAYTPPRKTQLVPARSYAEEAGASHGGTWQVGYIQPTEEHPFPEIELAGTAVNVPQSATHADVWCGAMNDSLELQYLSCRGEIICRCLLSFRPGTVDAQNQDVWDVVKEFAMVNQTFIRGVSKMQSTLNIAMARLGSTAFQCSDQLSKNMDIYRAVAPFERSVKQLNRIRSDIGEKLLEMREKSQILTDKVLDSLIGDVGIKDAIESLDQSEEDLTVARVKFLDEYGKRNAQVTQHKCRLVQLEEQLKDLKYTAALVKEYQKLLDEQTTDIVKHHYAMAKKATLAHDYFYERSVGGKVVYSHKILREADAKTTARRSEQLKRIMRGDSKDAKDKLDTIRASINKLKREYTSEKEKKIEAELVMQQQLMPLKMKLTVKTKQYADNIKKLEDAAENTGVVVKNLPLFLRAFQQIRCYNTDMQTSTDEVLDKVQAICDNLDDGLRAHKLRNKPLSEHRLFGGKLKPMIEALNDQGITECGDLAHYNDEEQMKILMKAILRDLRINHKGLLNEGGHSLIPGFKMDFEGICKEMSESHGYIKDLTQDIGGYLSTSFKAFKRGQKMIKKPTAQTLQLELGQAPYLRGLKAIKDTPVDELKHDSPSSDKPEPVEKLAKDRFIK